jgi:hypothetical protein
MAWQRHLAKQALQDATVQHYMCREKKVEGA